jgi:membrane protease YdiL (CAAX protease family)
MRSFLLFVGLLAASLIVAAAVTYPAWWLVSTVSIEPVHRVMNRVAMLFALIGLIVLTRRLGLASREATGYGLPRREFVRQLALGWLCGLALMLPLVFTLLGLDVRSLKPDLDARWIGLILGAIVSGLVVAFVEETFFRGVLFTAVARTSSVIAAVVTPSLLYAALHFLGGKLRLAPDEVSWLDGFTVLGRLFERYTEPLTFVDSFVALAMLGVLLSLVRLRTGAIAACIGLHAAGVATIAVLRDVTIVDRGSEYAAIVGSYDGVIGWAALAWFSLIGTAYVLLGRKKVAGGS